jgi:tetratricopeptide (TPR) repeat protein
MFMAAKLFSLITKHKLLLADLLVYAVIIILLLIFSRQLFWGQKVLRGYLFNGNIPASKDKLLVAEATRLYQEGKDTSAYKPLLEKALKIEPYSEAALLLGNIALWQGNEQKMLQYYEKYRSINPYVSSIYVNMTNVLVKQGDVKKAQLLLADGIKKYERRLELYKPVSDPNVKTEFNQKAVFIYQRTQQGLDLLKQIQQQLQSDVNKPES